MIKRRYICHAIAAVFCAIIVVPAVFLVRDNAIPVEIHKSTMTPPIVSPGQTVQISWVATDHRSCEGLIHRQFVDSSGAMFQMIPGPTFIRDPRDIGRRKTFIREIRIPTGVADGPATFSGMRRYWCNPLQRMLKGQFGMEIRVPTPVISFEVRRQGSENKPSLLEP